MRAWAQSVRGRTVLFGTLVVALFLLVAGLTFDSTARKARLNELERAALEQLESSCAVVKQEVVHPLPSPRDSLLLVQMVAPNGSVISSSANVMDMDTAFVGPLSDAVPVGKTVTDRAVIDSVDYLVVGRRVDATPGAASMYVAAPLSDVDRLSRSLRRQLLWWSPAFILSTGLGMAFIVGRSLRPVEKMRQRVASIEATDLSLRLEEPKSNDELSKLARTMNQMLDRLSVSADNQQRFVSDASHELRTPLAVMRTRLEVGLRNPAATDWPLVSKLLLDQSTRMERLVANLLALTKGRNPSAMTELVDLDELVRVRVSDMRVIHPDISFDLSRVSAGRVAGDADELARVVQNLLDNAATHSGGRVQASLFSGEDGVELAIEDDGPGVPEAERDRVFGRFTRLDSARTSSAGGAGLGLAIAADIVGRHGGSIRFEDPVGLPGARVVVRLPTAPEMSS
jgi:signal transduction histidine kinase